MTTTAPVLPTKVPGLRPWAPTADGGKALVLGGGGAVGIAWMGGLLVGLSDLGLDLRDADTMIGTSAGSVVAANARVGHTLEEGFRRLVDGEVTLPPARLRPVDGLRFFVSQTIPGNRRYGRALLGRAAMRASSLVPEAEWIDVIGHDLVGAPWPEQRLVITAVDARTGQSVAFDNDSGVPLERAMAASCAVPGIYPPVVVNGRAYVDGGVRTVTNADLAAGHERVVVLAPIPYALRPADRPASLVAGLGREVRHTVIVPDRASRAVMGRDFLDLTKARVAAQAGVGQAGRVLDRIAAVWR